MSWYIKGYDYQVGFDGVTAGFNGFFEPANISPTGSQELPTGYFHYLFWNTTEPATGERVTSTGQAMRLIDSIEAAVIRETWPKNGSGYTGVFAWNSAGISRNGAGLSGVERSGIFVDANLITIGVSDITNYYSNNAMTLVTAQIVTTPNAETANSITQFLMKCRAAMLRYSSTWTV
jgi:hypothetical protein